MNLICLLYTSSVPAQLTSGQEQINAGWQELSEKEQELEKGMSEITENENKISDAKQDLEEGRTKAAQDIADGEDKIADGEKKINDIPVSYTHLVLSGGTCILCIGDKCGSQRKEYQSESLSSDALYLSAGIYLCGCHCLW